METDGHLLELVERYVERSLTPEETSELRRAIERSPDARQTLRDALATDYHLRELLDPQFADISLRQGVKEAIRAEAEAGAFREETVRRIVGAEEGPEPHEQRVSLRRRRLIPSLAVAAGALAVAGVWWFTAGGGGSEGSEISTGKGQTIALRFDGEDTLVEMAENTKLRVVGGAVIADAEGKQDLIKSGPGKVIQLESGSIAVSVVKQVEGRSFVVKSPHAEMKVVGTKFSVGVGVDRKQTRVDVQEGVVRVRGLSGVAAVNLRSGVSATVEEGKGIELAGKAIQIQRGNGFVLPKEVGAAAGVAYDGNLMWVSSAAWPATLYGLELNSMQIQRRVDMSVKCRNLCSIAWGGGSLWAIAVTTNRAMGLLRISLPDCTVEEVVANTSYLAENSAVTYGGGFVWVANFGERDSTILRIDPKTGVVLSRIPIQTHARQEHDGFMWFDNGLWRLMYGGWLVRVNPDNGQELIKAQVSFDGNRGWWVLVARDERRFWAWNNFYRGGDVFDATFVGGGKQSPVNSDR